MKQALEKNNDAAIVFALIAVCIGYLIAPMGLSAVNVAVPDLALDLSASAAQVGWLPTLYILSSVMCFLPASRFADRYGRKRIFVYGLWLNMLASTLSGITDSIEWVLFYRFWQGVAAAMIFGTGIAIVTSIVPAHRRGVALGIVASCVYFGLTLAPAVGGYLTEFFGWRMVFLFQVPLFALLIMFIWLKLPGEWTAQETASMDWHGTGLFAVFAVLFVIGMTEMPTLLGMLMVAVSLVALFLFILHQSRIANPLLRVQMFRENRMFSLSLSTSFFMYGSNFALLFLLSVYLQFIHDLTPSQAGNILLLQALSMALIAPFAGKLADTFAPRLIATTGCGIVSLAFMVLNMPVVMAEPWWIGAGLLLVGIGFGLFSTPNNNAIMSSVPESEIGVASASMNLARTVGNLVGMSVVNLMIHVIIGDVEISKTVSNELDMTVRYALLMSLIMVVIATVTSSMRGR